MNIRFLNAKEKKKLIGELHERFGISDMKDYLLLETGKEKIRAFSGSFTREDILALGEIANVEIIGMYFAKRDFVLRLSFDALHLLKEQINKNIIEINDKEFEDWIRGKVIEKNVDSGIYVIKFNDDFLGCAFSNGKKLLNFVPKERQVRDKTQR